MSKRYYFFMLVLALGFACASPASAQYYASRVNRYVFSTFTSTYQSLTGATGISLTSQDDGTGSFALPFDFIYDSVIVPSGSSVWVSTNGFMRIGGANPGAGCCSDNVGASGYLNTVLPLSEDHYLNGTISWQVSGVTPSRVITIEWKQSTLYAASPRVEFNYQVKLYETTNVIEFLYGPNNFQMMAPATTNLVGVGLNGNTTSLRVGSGIYTTPATNYRFSPADRFDYPNISVTGEFYDFGKLSANQSATYCATVKAIGVLGLYPLTITNVSLISPDFQVASSLPPSLSTGQSVQLCVRYAPVTPGAQSAELVVTSNGVDSGTQTILFKGFGTVPRVEVLPAGDPTATDLFRKSRVRLGDSLKQSVVLRSFGVGPVTISNIKISGKYANQYTVVHAPPASGIPDGTIDSITFRYIAAAEGIRNAPFSFETDGLGVPIVTGSLNGTGVLPKLQITPRSLLTFDSLEVGGQVCKTITLYNPGSDTVRVKSNILTTQDADYTYTGLKGLDTVIPPDKSKQLTVCFNPVRNGTRVARIRLETDIPPTLESSPRDTSAFEIDIVGVGLPFGKLFVGGGATDTALVNTEVCSQDTLYNFGQEDILVTKLRFSGNDSSEYKYGGITLPFVLKAGGSQIVTVCSTPTKEGVRSSTLVIEGTSNGKAISINSNVSTYAPVVCATAQPGALFSITPLGKPDTALVTVTNCGEVGTIYSASISGSGYTVEGITSSPEVLPNGAVQFKVIYTPTVCGAQNATLTITGTKGVQSIPVTLNGSGVGTTFGTVIPLMSSPVGIGTEYSITVTNTSAFNWTPGTATVTGPFVVTQEVTPSTLGANQSGTVKVQFTPTNSGQNNAGSLSFVSGLPKECTVTTISLNGEGAVNGVRPEAASRGYQLEQNYPNPFNPVTEIRYSVPEASMVSLRVLDLTGRVVATLQEGRVGKGDYKVTFKADHLPSGTYLYELRSGDVRLTRELVLTK